MSTSVPPGYKLTEAGVIPKDWEVKSLRDEIAALEAGVSVRSIPSYEVQEGEYAILKTSAVEAGRLLIHERKAIHPADVRRARLTLRSDTILISRMNTIDLVGESGYVNKDYERVFLPDRLWMTRFSDQNRISAKWLSYVLAGKKYREALRAIATGTSGSMKNISKTSILALRFSCPPFPEQQAIAEALSDADAYIESLEQLIAKKRQIKQGAMQELLIGERRLLGFRGEWRHKKLGECLIDQPKYGINAPAFPYSDTLPKYIRITDINEYSQFSPAPLSSVSHPLATSYYLVDGDVVFARTGASVGKSYKYLVSDGPLVFAGFLIRVRPNPSILLPSYLSAFATTSPYWDWVRLMSMRSGQPGINANEYAQLPLRLPELSEQIAITDVFDELDGEIFSLETKLAKARDIKQGMMQDLLIGRIRLVATAKRETFRLVSETPTPERKPARSHNWQFNEAVIIGALSHRFGSEVHPLARVRRVKLTYLLHRHIEGQAEGFQKKAAGPYNPKVRYEGPEKIALQNGYAGSHHNGTYAGLVGGSSHAEALRYFENWYGKAALEWLDRFQYRKTEELELLATVDMALVEIRTAGGRAEVAAVKRVIANHPEWAPKLAREVFSDANIARAIAESTELFGA